MESRGASVSSARPGIASRTTSTNRQRQYLRRLSGSTHLRQSYDAADDEEKLDYVRGIMDLLELTPLQHAVVGTKLDAIREEQRGLTTASAWLGTVD